MSIHSSLRAEGKGRGHRSVLKRHERLKILREKNLWNPEKSVLGILKVKMQKVRVKKEKAAVPAEGSGAATTGTAAPAAGQAIAKPAAPAAKADKK